jgi:hypothetical protein
MTLIERVRPDGRKKILGLEQKLDSVEHVKDLQRVGQAVAEMRVKPEHFAGFA